MRSAILAPFLAGFLLLAGCSGGLEQESEPTTDPASFTTDEQGNVVPIENETVPLETGEPVLIEQTIDLAVPDSYTAAWDVKNGYRNFIVNVQLEGPNGAPFRANTGLGYRLVGGTPAKAIEQSDPNPASVTAGSPTCLICFDGARRDPNATAGAWSLALEWGPSAGTAKVFIQVDY